jgi:hypothetical protein
MGEGGSREVVLHYRDGSTRRGRLEQAFTPKDRFVEIATPEGDSVRAEFEGLKAVFFIKDPRRRDLEVQISSIDMYPATSGASARVEFFDGEVIHGRVSEYSVKEHGFFLFPTSVESNNERIFVVVQALTTLSVETVTEASS